VTLEEALIEVKKQRDDYCMALSKISDIRDSIVGQQGFNFSEHAYPLVAVLGSVGFEGKGYEISRENLGTLIEQRDRAEVERDKARAAHAVMAEAMHRMEGQRNEARDEVARLRKLLEAEVTTYTWSSERERAVAAFCRDVLASTKEPK
jgi:hypothetical protein